MNKLLAIASLMVSTNVYASNWLNILGQANSQSLVHNPILVDVDLAGLTHEGDIITLWVKWRYETPQHTTTYNADINGMQAVVFNEMVTRIDASCSKEDFHIYTQSRKFNGQVVQDVRFDNDNTRAFAAPDTVMSYTIETVCGFPVAHKTN